MALRCGRHNRVPLLLLLLLRVLPQLRQLLLLLLWRLSQLQLLPSGAAYCTMSAALLARISSMRPPGLAARLEARSARCC